MSNSNSKQTVSDTTRATRIAALSAKGDRYGHAAIAGVANLLVRHLNGDKMERGAAARIAERTGYDKGNLSRIVTILRTDKVARAAATKFDVMSCAVGSDKGAAFDEAVRVGSMFARKTSKGSGKGSGKGDSSDPLAAFVDFLTNADQKTFDANVALVNAAIARLTAERKAAAA